MIRVLGSALVAALIVCSVAAPARADTPSTIHLIGAAYAGEFATIQQRFPYVTEIDGFAAKGQAVGQLTATVEAALASANPLHYRLSTALLSDAQSAEAPVDLALVIDKEIVAQTAYDIDGRMVFKVLAQVRAQALYFNVRQSAIVRDIPLSFARISIYDHPPTHDEILRCVRLALFGSDGHTALLGKFISAVDTAPFPGSATKFFRVTRVRVADKAAGILGLASAGAVPGTQDLSNGIADTFAETFAADQGISFIPYTADYLVGNRIPLSLSNGDAFSLKLPSADYSVALDLAGLKEITFGQSAAGKSLIYGALVGIKLTEPISGHRYLDAILKNGVVVKVPAGQTSDRQNDTFAYDDAIRELFAHLSDAVTSGADDWTSKATSTPHFATQLLATRQLFQSCK